MRLAVHTELRLVFRETVLKRRFFMKRSVTFFGRLNTNNGTILMRYPVLKTLGFEILERKKILSKNEIRKKVLKKSTFFVRTGFLIIIPFWRFFFQ